MKKLAALPRITVAMSLAALPTVVLAQAAPPAQTELSEIEVLAKRVNARNRVDTAAPILSYDEEYFQRFEPLSVGDMMKRVPGVSFQSDIGEYAEPSLRGIGSEYTQILVNGRRVTGGTNDNTVVVDRIPAELVERVEIIRSPSSDIDSQGVGGTLNIILKEGAELSGGIYRVGAYYNDGETNPSAFLSFGDTNDNVEWGTSLNYQERFNRKAATELERALDGEGGVGAGILRGGRGPGRAREHRHRLDRRRARADGRGARMVRRRLLHGHRPRRDRNRPRVRGGGRRRRSRDGGSMQANQLDAFQETNYGVFTGFRHAVRRWPRLGNRGRLRRRPISSRSRRTG